MGASEAPALRGSEPLGLCRRGFPVAELKTKATNVNVGTFIDAIADEEENGS